MPNPVNQDQAVCAIDFALVQLDPPGDRIVNLDTNAVSNPEWSCNNFSPAVLDQVCEITGTPIDSLNTVEYPRDGALPDAFPKNTFVNISMMGDPSKLNHNFNILVSGETTYLIQVFVGFNVNIVRRFPNATFIENWHSLANNELWADSYNALFGVAPNTVVENPPQDTWLQNQYVTQ